MDALINLIFEQTCVFEIYIVRTSEAARQVGARRAVLRFLFALTSYLIVQIDDLKIPVRLYTQEAGVMTFIFGMLQFELNRGWMVRATPGTQKMVTQKLFWSILRNNFQNRYREAHPQKIK